MSPKVWIALGACLVVVLLLAIVASQVSVTTVTEGARGAQVLQERLRTACGPVVEEEPALRVFGVPPAAEGGPWRWKVEATLREGKRPGDALVDRALERVVASCFTTPVAGKPPGGLLLLLHGKGRPDWVAEYDGQGRRKAEGR